ARQITPWNLSPRAASPSTRCRRPVPVASLCPDPSVAVCWLASAALAESPEQPPRFQLRERLVESDGSRNLDAGGPHSLLALALRQRESAAGGLEFQRKHLRVADQDDVRHAGNDPHRL